MIRSVLRTLGVLCCVATAANAAVVPTGPTTVTSFQTPWYMDPFGNQLGGSSGIVPGGLIDGNGAAILNGDRTRFVAGNQFAGGPVVGLNMGLLSNVTACSFQWVVTAVGANSPAAQSAALRIHARDPVLNRNIQFIWEDGEQGTPVFVNGASPLGTVVSGDFFNADPNKARVWVFTTGFPSRGLYDSMGVLIPGSNLSQPFSSLLALLNSPNAFVQGISVGVGSSPGSGLTAYADHVRIAINGGIDEEYDFINASGSAVSLTTDDACVGIGEQLVVNVDLSDADDLVVGGQFFLQYDQTKLDFVSADPGVFPPSPFTQEIFESVNEGAGTIDYAVGIPPPGAGVVAGRMARFTFNVLDPNACTMSNLVTFRSHTPPTRITNNIAQSITPLLENNLGPVALDQTAPVITVPPNITVKSDAGFCSAVVNYSVAATDNCSIGQAFLDSGESGTFSNSNWITDRFEPGVWAPNTIDPFGGVALNLGIRNADRRNLRAGAFSSSFYDTQGRQRGTTLPQGWEVSGKLFIPSSWVTPGNLRRSDLWSRDANPVEANARYPIVGFINNDPTDGFNPLAANFQPRFRVWNSGAGLWIDLPPTVAPVLNRYNSFRIKDTGTSYEVFINNALVATLSGVSYSPPAGTGLSRVFIEAFNFGNADNAGSLPDSSYDVYWKDVAASGTFPGLTLSCSPPSGSVFAASVMPHTVTCTATDACGNTTVSSFTVTVQNVSEMVATVQLDSVSPGTMTRAITFDLFDADCPNPAATVCSTMTFINGLGTAIVDVPCGLYTCSTARDRLHTLRRTDAEFGITGTQYVTNYTTAAPTNDSLLGGNVNDDEFIDILDFGGFVGQFAQTLGANTTCATPPLHSDFSGDGSVGVADFSFIQTQFLFAREADCCSNAVSAPPGQPGGPVIRISAQELVDRDLPELRIADFNRDGWLDEQDVVAFINGARPCGADINRDGNVDSADFFTFLSSFFAGTADYNTDGATTSDDFFMFLNAFFGGC